MSSKRMRPSEVLENPLPVQLASETVIMAPNIAVNQQIAVNDSSTEAVQTITTKSEIPDYKTPIAHVNPIVIPIANSGNATFGGYPIMTDPQSVRVEFELELADLDMKRWIPDTPAGMIVNGTFGEALDIGWTGTAGAGGDVSIWAPGTQYGGQCALTSVSNPSRLRSDAIQVVSGESYTVTFDRSGAEVAGEVFGYSVGTSAQDDATYFDGLTSSPYSLGSNLFKFTATGTTEVYIHFIFTSAAGNEAGIDNVVMGVSITGADLVINGDFASALIDTDLILNGDFATNDLTNWNTNLAAGGTAVATTGTLVINNNSGTSEVWSDAITTIVGVTYQVKFDLGGTYDGDRGVGVQKFVYGVGTSSTSDFTDYDSSVSNPGFAPGTISFTFVASTTTSYVNFDYIEVGFANVTIDNVIFGVGPWYTTTSTGTAAIVTGALQLTADDVLLHTHNGDFTEALITDGWDITTSGGTNAISYNTATAEFLSTGVVTDTCALITDVIRSYPLIAGKTYIGTFTRTFVQGTLPENFRFGLGDGSVGNWDFYDSGASSTPVYGANTFTFICPTTGSAFFNFDAHLVVGQLQIDDVTLSEMGICQVYTASPLATVASTQYRATFDIAAGSTLTGASGSYFQYGAGTGNNDFSYSSTIVSYPNLNALASTSRAFLFTAPVGLTAHIAFTVFDSTSGTMMLDNVVVTEESTYLNHDYVGSSWTTSLSSSLTTAHNIEVGVGGSGSYATTPLRLHRNLPAEMGCFMGASGATVGTCTPSNTQTAMYAKQGGDAYFPPSCSAYPTRLEPFDWIEISFPFSDNAKTIRIQDPARIKTFFSNIVKQKDRKTNFESTKWTSKFKRLNNNKRVPSEDLTYDKDKMRYAAGEWFEDLAVGDKVLYAIYVCDIFEEFDKNELMYLPNIQLTFQLKPEYRQLFVKHISPVCSSAPTDESVVQQLPSISYPDVLRTDIQNPNTLAIAYSDDLTAPGLDNVDYATTPLSVNTVTGSHWNINAVSVVYDTFFSRRIVQIPEFFNAYQRFTLNYKFTNTLQSGNKVLIKTTHFGNPKGLFIFPEVLSTVNADTDTQVFFTRRWKDTMQFEFKHVRMDVDGARYPTNEIYKSYNMDTTTGGLKREYLDMMRKTWDVTKTDLDEFDPHTERFLPLLYIPLDAVVRDIGKANEKILGSSEDKNTQYDLELEFGTTDGNAWGGAHDTAMQGTKFFIAFVQDHSCRMYGNRVESTSR